MVNDLLSFDVHRFRWGSFSLEMHYNTPFKGHFRPIGADLFQCIEGWEAFLIPTGSSTPLVSVTAKVGSIVTLRTDRVKAFGIPIYDSYLVDSNGIPTWMVNLFHCILTSSQSISDPNVDVKLLADRILLCALPKPNFKSKCLVWSRYLCTRFTRFFCRTEPASCGIELESVVRSETVHSRLYNPI
ncbi:hypothetical protein P9112_000416 [Eukaryota sp. TZLM1-RC]